MYDLTATCRNAKCVNYQKPFTKREKKATYVASDEREHPRTDLACPVCRCWGRITEIKEVQ